MTRTILAATTLSAVVAVLAGLWGRYEGAMLLVPQAAMTATSAWTAWRVARMAPRTLPAFLVAWLVVIRIWSANETEDGRCARFGLLPNEVHDALMGAEGMLLAAAACVLLAGVLARRTEAGRWLMLAGFQGVAWSFAEPWFNGCG